MKTIIKTGFIFIIFFIFFGCDKNSPLALLVTSPECKITEQSPLRQATDGKYYIDIKVENTGDGPTAKLVSVFAKIKKTALIVDETSGYVYELKQGQSKNMQLKFQNFSGTQQYDHIYILVTWQDTEGKSYSKEY